MIGYTSLFVPYGSARQAHLPIKAEDVQRRRQRHSAEEDPRGLHGSSDAKSVYPVVVAEGRAKQNLAFLIFVGTGGWKREGFGVRVDEVRGLETHPRFLIS